jgi:hypothetical protein
MSTSNQSGQSRAAFRMTVSPSVQLLLLVLLCSIVGNLISTFACAFHDTKLVDQTLVPSLMQKSKSETFIQGYINAYSNAVPETQSTIIVESGTGLLRAWGIPTYDGIAFGIESNGTVHPMDLNYSYLFPKYERQIRSGRVAIESIQVITAGWPFQSAYGIAVLAGDQHTLVQSHVSANAYATNGLVGIRLNGDQRIYWWPWLPKWRGALLNVLCFAAVLYACVATCSLARRLARVYHNRCWNCGYDRKGHDRSASCPECGEMGPSLCS